MTFDGSGNPEDFPTPATRVNKRQSLSSYWKTTWDSSKTTVTNILRQMDDELIFYEVTAFYNAFYGEKSMIKDIISATSRLNLNVDITSDRTYPGPSMDYKSGQAKSSNYVLSESISAAAAYAKALRKAAYSGYIMALGIDLTDSQV